MKLAVLGCNGASGRGSANLDKVGLGSARISSAERTGVGWLKKAFIAYEPIVGYKE